MTSIVEAAEPQESIFTTSFTALVVARTNQKTWSGYAMYVTGVPTVSLDRNGTYQVGNSNSVWLWDIELSHRLDGTAVIVFAEDAYTAQLRGSVRYGAIPLT